MQRHAPAHCLLGSLYHSSLQGEASVCLACAHHTPITPICAHRSGRTGRANKAGTALVLFTEKEARTLGIILKATKVRAIAAEHLFCAPCGKVGAWEGVQHSPH